VAEIDLRWFDNCRTVLITAGASAPETVVQECVDFLVDRFGADVEPVTIRQENVYFQLPRELRVLQSSL
jgi:4-hydroxy-3-methylbut-2-enyl diphosphate reductase